jgi:hypothetical protein
MTPRGSQLLWERAAPVAARWMLTRYAAAGAGVKGGATVRCTPNQAA